MLIRFAVENFRSYKDQQVISMVAGKYTRHPSHVAEILGHRILKGSFFFGANASGKSNLFEAVLFAQSIAMQGADETPLLNQHFRIDPTYARKPGVFQFDIFANNHFYSYGFSVFYDRATIEEEWLYRQEQDGETEIFHRTLEQNRTEVTTEINFSSQTQEQMFEVFAKTVPDHKTLLQEIAERKLVDQEDFQAFKDIMQWMAGLVVITPDSTYRRKLEMFSVEGNRYDLERILNNFDTGIEKVLLVKKDLDSALNFLPEHDRKKIEENLELDFSRNPDLAAIGFDMGNRALQFEKKNGQMIVTQLQMNHGNPDDLFELGDESDGTKRLFDLMPMLRKDQVPRVVLIDELDRSFHSKLVEAFINQFYDTTEGVNSQLIASVHDTNIMDLDLLRQDEIWFVERQTDKRSHIYSLNRFKERFDKKIEKDYLLGRYGAIPCLLQGEKAVEEGES